MTFASLLAVSDTILVELVKIIPGVLWVLLAVLVVIYFRAPLRALLPRLRSFKLGAFEAQFDAAITAAAKTRDVQLTDAERSRVTRRAIREAETLAGARILWLDDDHTRTASERAALEALGVEVATAATDAEALQRLSAGSYDLLISDINRDNDDQAGIDFARDLRSKHHGLPIIFYIQRVDPAKPLPIEAFGLTNRPDELMHLTMDALARRRG